MRTVRCAILLLTGFVLSACSSSGTGDIGPTDPTSGNGAPATPPPTLGFRPMFQPLQGILPYPTDLYFGGTNDGTLNLPTNAVQPAVPFINALDGFSTTSYISARFDGTVNAASLTAANVRVIRLVLDNATKAPLVPPAAGGALPVPLTFGTDFTVSLAPDTGSNGNIVIIRPVRPLEPSTGGTNIGYLVLFTNGVTSSTGAAAVADADYATVRNQAIAEINAGVTTPTCTPITNSSLNTICRLTFAHLRVAAAVGVNPSNVVLSFAFSTQSTRDTLGIVAQTIAGSPPPAIAAAALPGPGPSGRLVTSDVVPGTLGKADLRAGTLRIPYYLVARNAACDSAATIATCGPVSGSWTAAGAPPAPFDPASRNLTRFNPVPLKTADLDIPLLVTVPNAAAVAGAARPTNGWPVVIFQHGLTRNRLDAIAIADSFADAGFVVVSIDLPLHGVSATNAAAPVFRQASRERTFDLDASNNTTLAPGPDGVIDGSGQNFVNISSLLTTRDNLRQGTVDLLALTRALPTLELTGDTTPDIDASRIHFVGHSLGSIVGATYASLSANTKTASLLMAGGGVALTIVESPAFGPAIISGLQARGLIQGTTPFNQFFRDAQTVTDAGDPANYFAALLAAKPVHLTQVVGGGTAGWPSDLVVPNTATQRLLAAGGAAIRRLSATGAVTPGNAGYVNFTFGHHGSIIDPSCSGLPAGFDATRCRATTVEMQRQTVNFAFLNGASIVITDGTVIQP